MSGKLWLKFSTFRLINYMYSLHGSATDERARQIRLYIRLYIRLIIDDVWHTMTEPTQRRLCCLDLFYCTSLSAWLQASSAWHLFTPFIRLSELDALRACSSAQKCKALTEVQLTAISYIGADLIIISILVEGSISRQGADGTENRDVGNGKLAPWLL